MAVKAIRQESLVKGEKVSSNRTSQRWACAKHEIDGACHPIPCREHKQQKRSGRGGNATSQPCQTEGHNKRQQAIHPGPVPAKISDYGMHKRVSPQHSLCGMGLHANNSFSCRIISRA